MMSVIRGEPALWVNVKSVRGTGPYAEKNMQAWNHALLRACSRYPNMRVLNWAAVVKRQWFIPDGIHYTSPGYAQRSRLIAEALAVAFPRAASVRRLSILAQRLLTAQERASCLVS
jgi:hypothetical protein